MSEEVKAAPAAIATATPAIDSEAFEERVAKRASKAATKAASKTEIKASQLASALEKLVEPSKREKRAARIEQAEADGANGVLKGLGVKKAERSRMLEEIKAGKVEIAARRIEAETAKAEAIAAKATIEKSNPYVERMKVFADEAYEALPEAFQKALTDMGMNDPLERLKVIDVWKKNGVVDGAPSSSTAKASDKAVPKPATTLGASGPAAPKAGPALNYLEMYQSLKNSGQKILAAQYWNRYGNLIEGLRGQ